MPESRDPRFAELDALIAAEPQDARITRPGSKAPRPKPGPRPPCPLCNSASSIHKRNGRNSWYCYACNRAFTPDKLPASQRALLAANARWAGHQPETKWMRLPDGRQKRVKA